jgi:hypothetical protein
MVYGGLGLELMFLNDGNSGGPVDSGSGSSGGCFVDSMTAP